MEGEVLYFILLFYKIKLYANGKHERKYWISSSVVNAPLAVVSCNHFILFLRYLHSSGLMRRCSYIIPFYSLRILFTSPSCLSILLFFIAYCEMLCCRLLELEVTVALQERFMKEIELHWSMTNLWQMAVCPDCLYLQHHQCPFDPCTLLIAILELLLIRYFKCKKFLQLLPFLFKQWFASNWRYGNRWI